MRIGLGRWDGKKGPFGATCEDLSRSDAYNFTLGNVPPVATS